MEDNRVSELLYNTQSALRLLDAELDELAPRAVSVPSAGADFQRTSATVDEALAGELASTTRDSADQMIHALNRAIELVDVLTSAPEQADTHAELPLDAQAQQSSMTRTQVTTEIRAALVSVIGHIQQKRRNVTATR
jgi:hypothetical protein